jgi:hypothetical protein
MPTQPAAHSLGNTAPPPSSVCTDAGAVPDPTQLRTWAALRRTVAYLRSLLARVGRVSGCGPGGPCAAELALAQSFIWDRCEGCGGGWGRVRMHARQAEQ